MMDMTMIRPHTFNNMFLDELNTKTQNIQTSMTKLYSNAKDYNVKENILHHILDSTEALNDFRNLIADEDEKCCADPDQADCDPGDCAPGHEDEANDSPQVAEVLCKLIRGCELGYLDIPTSLQMEIDKCLLRL